MFAAAALLVYSVAWPTVAPALDIPAQHHPWAKFPVGSWSKTRLVQLVSTEDGQEKITKTVLTTTKLISVEETGYTLQEETQIDEMPGEDPKTLMLGWDGLPADSQRDVSISVSEVKIEGRSFVCQTHETSSMLAGEELSVKWWYCPDQAPYLLKKLTRIRGQAPRTITAEVIALGVARKVLDEELPCDQTRTTETATRRSLLSTRYSSRKIPGGIVYSETEIRDKQLGQLERTRLTLEAFEIAP